MTDRRDPTNWTADRLGFEAYELTNTTLHRFLNSYRRN